MSRNHHRILAKSPNNLLVRGDYLEVSIESIVLDATVRPLSHTEEFKQFVLIEAIYSNLWEHRIPISNNQLLIDNNGFQHSAYSDWYEATVHKSKHLKKGTELPGIADVIEGNARSRGWIAFPTLGKAAVPHRFIFQIETFDPGYTSGSVRHSETLELVLDLSLFGRLLGERNTKYRPITPRIGQTE